MAQWVRRQTWTQRSTPAAVTGGGSEGIRRKLLLCASRSPTWYTRPSPGTWESKR